MTVCNRCGKENQDHYKFCLGCGAELTVAAPPRQGAEMGMMKTMMADPAQAPAGAGAALRPNPPPGLGGPPLPPPRPVGAISGMPPAGPLAPPPSPPPAPGYPPAYVAPTAPLPRRCPSCGSDVPPTFRFCGTCGFRMEEASGASPMPRQPPAPVPRVRMTMTLIRPDGTEGGVHELQQGDNKLGRQFGAVFEHDGYLSPVHASLLISGQSAVLRDLDSLNGVFVKMTGEEELASGQIIRIGQELLRFDVLPPLAQSADGTDEMGSPNPGYWGKLTVIIGRDVTGASYPLLADTVTLGRERGEINFPDDGYVSGLHARVSLRDGRVYIADLGSSNGSFIKVNGERAVGHDSFVLLGQQLFRINLLG